LHFRDTPNVCVRMPKDTEQWRADLVPSVAVAVSGVLWGLFWLPFRAFGEAGFEGGWASLAFYLGATLMLLPRG